MFSVPGTVYKVPWEREYTDVAHLVRPSHNSTDEI